ncbi:MAG: hypothetical protein HKN91_08575 [Acidimicrobiia bacterium]|nr:hypothetical protein [Acidimicrobiia bacterium]
MTFESPTDLPPLPDEVGSIQQPLAKPKRDPASVLTSAMVVYVIINLLFAIPLLIAPAAFFDAIGFSSIVAGQLDGLRWVGAVLLAWAVSGFLVLARPEGRAIFVTTGALQLTFGALAFVYSWSISEYEWSLWYQVVATMVLVAGAAYMLWARLRGRSILKGEEA